MGRGLAADIDRKLGRRLETRAITVTGVDELARWLEGTLGARLSAFAADLSQRDLGRIAQGEEAPAPKVEQRLRNLFAVTSLLAQRDGAGSAYAWLMEPNPDLGNRPPAELLRAGEAPDAVWFAAAPAF